MISNTREYKQPKRKERIKRTGRGCRIAQLYMALTSAVLYRCVSCLSLFSFLSTGEIYDRLSKRDKRKPKKKERQLLPTDLFSLPCQQKQRCKKKKHSIKNLSSKSNWTPVKQRITTVGFNNLSVGLQDEIFRQ